MWRADVIGAGRGWHGTGSKLNVCRKAEGTGITIGLWCDKEKKKNGMIRIFIVSAGIMATTLNNL